MVGVEGVDAVAVAGRRAGGGGVGGGGEDGGREDGRAGGIGCLGRHFGGGLVGY